MTGYTLAQKAKAIVAFVGAVATGALTVLANTDALDWEIAGQSVGYWLAGIVALATYVATFKIPNAPGGTGTAGEVEGTH